MEAKKILLILGAGPNVANSTAQIFASKGYKIALMSRGRGAAAFDPSYLYIQSDLSQAGSIASVFAQVRQAYGSPPNIVIHNGKPNQYYTEDCGRRPSPPQISLLGQKDRRPSKRA